MHYDVIVVGAGPAGSTTARECASRGLSVLMLDKAEFPRDKPCGGGVTIRAAGLLPFEITPVVERVISKVLFTERQSRGFARTAPNKVTYLTQRSRLDAFLAERAVRAGAEFRQREAVREVERRSTHVLVRTPIGSFKGRTLVAADGANGKTAKLAGLDARLLQGLAMEGNISPPGGLPEKWQDTMGFDFGGLPGGYGWVFPKGDHLNIGLGGWRHIGPTLRDRLDRLVRFHEFDPDDLWGVRGYHLPLRQPGSALADGNVVLVGDAAGLLDPLTGEGIFAAFWSGAKAAEHIASYLGEQAPDLQGYRREMERGLLQELRVSRQFHDVFHLWPGFFVGVERRSSILWRAVAHLLRGEWTYLSVKQKLRWLWPFLVLISDLVRVFPPLRRLAGLPDSIPPERYFRRRDRGPAPYL